MKDPLEMALAELEALVAIDPARVVIPPDPNDAGDGDVTAAAELSGRYADAFRKARRQTGLTQAQFAKAIGYTLDDVRDWEQVRTPIPKPAFALAQLLREHSSAVGRAMASAPR